MSKKHEEMKIVWMGLRWYTDNGDMWLAGTGMRPQLFKTKKEALAIMWQGDIRAKAVRIYLPKRLCP